MNELTTSFTNYSEFKQSLDNELKANVEGFVRIGYLLKVARDTDILKESGHKNVAEFAAAEYGLTKDVVSRYIAINDRYSEGGYSDRLQVKYEGFGVSKLQEMLTLPDSIIEEITPTLTRQEILTIKKEVAAEEAITPIEVAIEVAAPEVQQEEKELTFPVRVWKQYFSADTTELEKEKFLRLACPFFDSIVTDEAETKVAKEKFFDVFGGRIVFARVPGIGKIMISVSEQTEDKIVFTNSRTGEKQEFKSLDVLNDIKDLIDARGCYADVFDELFREKKAEEPKPGAPKVEEPKAAEPETRENEATKHYQDEIKAYKEKTGWDPNADWTPEKGKEYEEKEKVAPVQPEEDFMPKPGSWTYEKPKENTQEENKHEEERSKETDGSRTDSNENRKVQESTADITKLEGCKERIRAERLGQLNVGDRIVNVDDGTKGTMLGYCAGEYKIQTETGLILVSENSTRWKKEDVIEAEKVTEVKTDDNDSKDRAAKEAQVKVAVEIIRDKIETISTICLELVCQDYGPDDIVKSFDAISGMAEKIKQTAKEYLAEVQDGND